MATPNGIIYYSAKSPQHPKVHAHGQGTEYSKHNGYSNMPRLKFSNKGFWEVCGKLSNRVIFRGSPVLCRSTETRDTETKEVARTSGDYSNISSVQENDQAITVGKVIPSSQAIAEACKFACNDAKFVNERAKNDIVLLSRGIMRMDARARQDVAFLGSEFLKLDARAREDTEKVDNDVKKRAERIHHVATILKNIAETRLKKAADRHWSDGALEADLRRADFVAKQRAMEDSLTALEFVKNIHDRMVSKMYRLKRSSIDTENTRHITLEKNGKTLKFLSGEVSADRITAIQEAYWDIASALSEADGIDYTDPEELELLVATLIDLDAMDGKSSVSLLAECSSSPDVNTRKALANALSAAPSMWTLGNAGMGALQRLAEDDNPAIAAAASKTILELKRQWEIGEGDSWRFMVDEQKHKHTQNMKKLSFLLLPILLLVIISHVHSQLPSRAPVNWYVLQWPPTYCIQLNNENPPGRCIEPILEHNFTLHGLWPADANGYTISCTDSVTVNWNQLIPPIESELNKFWPNLREGLPKWSLWKNEYNKHGVCGGLAAKEYFDAAISINKKITLGNLFNYLKTSGIIACDSLAFTKDQIITAVQKVFSSPLHVYLRCPSTGKNATHGYLNEVVLCTDLVKGQYNFISCPQPATPQTCDKFQLLMLPHPQPQSTKAAQRFEEEIDETSPELEQSWAKYAFSI